MSTNIFQGFVELTQDQYNALLEVNPNKIYIITDKGDLISDAVNVHDTSSTSHPDMREEITAKWVLLNELDTRSRDTANRVEELDHFFDLLLAAYYDNGERIVVLENELLGSAKVLTRIEGRL